MGREMCGGWRGEILPRPLIPTTNQNQQTPPNQIALVRIFLIILFCIFVVHKLTNQKTAVPGQWVEIWGQRSCLIGITRK